MRERIVRWIVKVLGEVVRELVVEELQKKGKVVIGQEELDRMVRVSANMGYERGKHDGMRETEERYLVGYWGKRKLDEEMKNGAKED